MARLVRLDWHTDWPRGVLMDWLRGAAWPGDVFWARLFGQRGPSLQGLGQEQLERPLDDHGGIAVRNLWANKS